MTPFTRGRGRPAFTLMAALATMTALSGCSGSSMSESSASAAASATDSAITVKNCDKDLTVDKPITSLYAYDGGIISIALAAGARKELVAVTGMARDKDVLELAYPDADVDGLKVVGDEYPTLETVLAVNPEMMFAGYNYGFSESRNLMPEMLTERGIDVYLLSETCLQEDGKRGTMDPWTALDTDLRNIGTLTGHAETGEKAADEITERRKALESAPQPEDKPTAFLFDSGTDAIFTSGKFGGPQAIFDSAGITNATADVEDTWTEVGWERLAASDPDIIYFVDYPGQTYQEKVAVLEANPASRNLTAVKEKRFVNLPYALWVSSPQNIDAAEWVRHSMEHFGLAPKTDITSPLDITKLPELPGNEWAR